MAKKAKERDFYVRRGTIFHAVTHQPVGKVLADGTCEGPHPWNNNETIVASSPAELRELQRQLAKTEAF